MGRPINKRYFGATADDNIKVQFFNGTASVPGFIVKQKGSTKFLCEDAEGNTAVCLLKQDIAAASLVEGEMTITVKLDDGTVTQISKISAHRITAGGNSYPWNFSTSTTDEAVQVEEAGVLDTNETPADKTDDTLVGSTDLEGDETPE